MNALVINAAGIGSRCNSNIPKQFTEISYRSIYRGNTILDYTLDTFLFTKLFSVIVVVTLPEYINRLRELYDSNVIVVEGSATCLRSRIAGLSAIKHINQIDKVMFHDSVRPFVSETLITKCISTCKSYTPCVVPFIETVSALKYSKNIHAPKLIQDRISILQTPETFMFSDICRAVESIDNIDDCQTLPHLFELSGNIVTYIKGDLQNFKITMSDDLDLAMSIINGKFRN